MRANILVFNGVTLSVVCDVLVYSKVPLVVSSILRICQPVCEDAHRGRDCVCAFIGLIVVLCNLKKT